MHQQAHAARQRKDPAAVSTGLALASLMILLVASPLTAGLAMLISGPLGLASLACALVARQRAGAWDPDELLLANGAVLVAGVTVALHVVAVILGAVLIFVFRAWMSSWAETATVLLQL